MRPLIYFLELEQRRGRVLAGEMQFGLLTVGRQAGLTLKSHVTRDIETEGPRGAMAERFRGGQANDLRMVVGFAQVGEHEHLRRAVVVSAQEGGGGAIGKVAVACAVITSCGGIHLAKRPPHA